MRIGKDNPLVLCLWDWPLQRPSQGMGSLAQLCLHPRSHPPLCLPGASGGRTSPACGHWTRLSTARGSTAPTAARAFLPLCRAWQGPLRVSGHCSRRLSSAHTWAPVSSPSPSCLRSRHAASSAWQPAFRPMPPYEGSSALTWHLGCPVSGSPSDLPS